MKSWFAGAAAPVSRVQAALAQASPDVTRGTIEQYSCSTESAQSTEHRSCFGPLFEMGPTALSCKARVPPLPPVRRANTIPVVAYPLRP